MTVATLPMPVLTPVVPRLAEANGRTFEDVDGRTLTVTAVRPGAEDGREVLGELISGAPAAKKPYSTDAAIFRAIWLERAPRWHPRRPGEKPA